MNTRLYSVIWGVIFFIGYVVFNNLGWGILSIICLIIFGLSVLTLAKTFFHF
jgi:hypothetical protein